MQDVAGIDLEDLWACASQEALQRTTDLGRRALRAPIAVITSFTPDRQIIRSVSDTGRIIDSLTLSGLLCREVADTGRPVLLTEVPVEGRHAAIMRDVPIEAYVGAPIRLSSGPIVGTLCVLDVAPHGWSDEDLALVTELCGFLASQIELKLESRERERAEGALTTTKAALLAVADHIPGLVFERRKIAPGRSKYTFFGSSKMKLPAVQQLMDDGGDLSLKFVHPDDRTFVRAALLRSNIEETDLDLTFRVKDFGNQLRWLRSQSIVRRDAEGKVCWDGLCFDITDLVDARHDAELARAAKDTLLINVNHELRSPLQAIIGFTDFLKSETRPELVAAHAKNIQAAAESLLAIVNQLLAQAGGERQLPEAMARVDIKAFGETCLSMIGPAAGEKRLQSHLEIDEDVPASIFLDGQKLHQAVVNLLNNAVKFTNEGRITLRVSRAAKGLRFSVVDTGIGIPEEKRGLLFQRFSRLAPEDASREGTGLGLSISKSIVESMDGEIGVERHMGSGTTFWLDIPIRLEPARSRADESAPAEPAAAKPTADAPAGLRILLADDLDLNRRLIADMLGIDGHSVDCVTNGAAAVQAATQRPYDLILMDMIMPEMDGLAATRAIRALPAPASRTPILALTANSFQEQLDDCLKAGMNATLVKPLTLDALSSAVTTWTQGRHEAA